MTNAWQARIRSGNADFLICPVKTLMSRGEIAKAIIDYDNQRDQVKLGKFVSITYHGSNGETVGPFVFEVHNVFQDLTQKQ